jgi:DNA polymerase-3 subunit gamma/tau
VLGAVDHSVYHELMEALVENRVESVIEAVGNIVEQGKDLYQFVNEFIWYLRNLLVLKNVGEAGNLVDVSAENLQEMRQYAERVEMEMLFRYIRVLSELANEMKYSSNKRVIFEVALIRLCRPQMQQDYDSLVNRLHNLEQTNEDLQAAIASGQFTAPTGAGDMQKNVPVVKKEIRPEAVPEDVRAVVGNWKQILRQTGPVTRSMLEDVLLSVSDSGALVLAFSQETRAQYFQKEENRQELIEAAGQLTGKEITVDIRFVESRQELQTLPELRNVIKNVEIEMID